MMLSVIHFLQYMMGAMVKDSAKLPGTLVFREWWLFNLAIKKKSTS